MMQEMSSALKVEICVYF